MKEFKSPKIIIYKNVDKLVSILEKYVDDCSISYEDLAMKILDKFNIPYGKKTELEPFQNNIIYTIREEGK